MGVDDPRWTHWVTLYTDGSYHHERGGFYGFRVRHGIEPYRIEDFGEVPDCPDPNVAEMAAIVYGIQRILETYERVDGVGVKTDSQTAISVLKFGAHRHRRKDYNVWQDLLREVLAEKERVQGSVVKVRIQWVKGHQGKGTTQAWLNNRVDALARKAGR